MEYTRTLNLNKYQSSAFIFGPRMTGKTSLLRKLSAAKYYDLLDPSLELSLRSAPQKFWDEVSLLRTGSLVIVDEIQRVPSLLDYVQMGIDQKAHRYLLSGSSARKLKRGAANLLGGRALDLRLHPLTHEEIGEDFQIDVALQFGTLPKIYNMIASGAVDEARLLLQSYYTTYIKEEIQAEAIVRNLAGFQRFLPIAASADARTVEYANISRDCSVPDSTIKDFFEILDDTLIGRFVWPWDRSERKKARPKFYLFDCGVTRMLLNRLKDPPTGQELGLLFESWFINEISRLKDYHNKTDTISFWRNDDQEIDILVHNLDEFRLAIEVKSGEISPQALLPLKSFAARHPNVQLIIASLKDKSPRMIEGKFEVLPWKDALSRYVDS